MDAALSTNGTSTENAPKPAARKIHFHIHDDAYTANLSRQSHASDVMFPSGQKPLTDPVGFEIALPDATPLRDYYGQETPRTVKVVVWGDHVFVGYRDHYEPAQPKNGRAWDRVNFISDPLVHKCRVKRISEPYTKTVTREVYRHGQGVGWYSNHRWEMQTFVDRYPHPGSNWRAQYHNELVPEDQGIEYLWLKYRITLNDGTEFDIEIRNELPTTGNARVDDDGTVHVDVDFLGHKQTFSCETIKQLVESKTHTYGRIYGEKNNPLFTLLKHMAGSKITDGIDRWWTIFLNHQPAVKSPDTKGLSSVLTKKANKPCFEKLEADYPVEWRFLTWLMSGRTADKFKNNDFIKAMFEEQGFDADKIAAEIQRVMKNPGKITASTGHWEKETYFDTRRKIVQSFGSSAEVIRVVEAKTDFRKRKTNEGKAEGLGIDPDIYPKLHAAVVAGDIPASVFANPDGTPLNREFVLWERALNQKGWAETIYSIAQDAGRRSTYEKDVTPYLAFLFKLGPYLDRHTPGRKKWSCKPKYVESEWELEMGNDGEGANDNGTTKRRSAFTPVADNDTRVVEVPYVAVCVTGQVSQWCYSKEYYVFEEMMIDPISKGVVVNEVEEKLNGRDDYGLMFYTLNGTATATGYPTFLIIFERREQDGGSTFVHFHRVHPKRKNNGQWTPACNLIEKVYQYMAGDVPATDVKAQQGDMIYIAHGNDPIKAGAKVEEEVKAARALNFESHNHIALGEGQEVKLYVSTAKTPKNRLGFIEVGEGGMAVRHPEHDDIDYLSPGWYEVRRCRSWEANPRAIWSLTID
jgi:hypothetical protein